MGPLQHRPRGRIRGLTPAIDIATDLPGVAGEVWAAVTTAEGVNAELAPYIRMTFPGDRTFTDLRPGKDLLASWLLALGVLPFDRHVFGLESIGPGAFVEVSHSWLQKLWRHERTVTAVAGGGCRVRDVVTVEPRIGPLTLLTRTVVAAIFRHRHRRLARLYG